MSDEIYKDQIDALIKKLSGEFKKEEVDLMRTVTKSVSTYAKEAQIIIKEMVTDHKRFLDGKYKADEYNNVIMLKQRAILDLIGGASEETMNTVMYWVYKFIEWAAPVALSALGGVATTYLKSKGIKL